MKKLLVLLVVLFPIGFLQAQDTFSKHEIFVGYGFGPISLSKVDLPVDEFSGAVYSVENENKHGTQNIGYMFHVSDRFAIGLSYANTSIRRNIVLGSAASVNGKVVDKYNIIMPSAKYEWYEYGSRWFVYSRIAAGLTFARGKATYINIMAETVTHVKHSTSFSWQVIPVGIEYDLPYFSIFAEAGAGVCGYAQLGFRVRI
ncbi:MAG: hypothetical protein LKI53_07470 [Bacteroidales bacterium]|jgi:hypothetical protein|nr:hypothetical protein [Bacteroidales bacterium]